MRLEELTKITEKNQDVAIFVGGAIKHMGKITEQGALKYSTYTIKKITTSNSQLILELI